MGTNLIDLFEHDLSQHDDHNERACAIAAWARASAETLRERGVEGAKYMIGLKVKHQRFTPFWRAQQTDELLALQIVVKGRIAAGEMPNTRNLGNRYGSMIDQKAQAVSPIIAEAREAGHRTTAAIADYLNAKDLPSPRGGKWHPSAVHRLLHRLEGLAIASGV